MNMICLQHIDINLASYFILFLVKVSFLKTRIQSGIEYALQLFEITILFSSFPFPINSFSAQKFFGTALTSLWNKAYNEHYNLPRNRQNESILCPKGLKSRLNPCNK